MKQIALLHPGCTLVSGALVFSKEGTYITNMIRLVLRGLWLMHALPIMTGVDGGLPDMIYAPIQKLWFSSDTSDTVSAS